MSMIPLLTSVLFIFFNLRIPLSMIHFYLSVLFIFWSENHIVNDLPTYVRPVYKNPPSPPTPLTFGKSARTSKRPACWPLRELFIILRKGKYGNRLDMNRLLLNSEDQKGCTSKIEFLTKITINPCSTRT